MNKNEKIKLAIDVALLYFAIITVMSTLSRIFTFTLVNGKDLTAVFGVSLPWFIVSIIAILFLAILSNKLRSNVQENISISNKSLLFIIVGILLIISGITNTTFQATGLKLYLDNFQFRDKLSAIENTRLTNGIIPYIISVVVYLVQIGVGVYFTLITSKINKQTGEAPQV